MHLKHQQEDTNVKRTESKKMLKQLMNSPYVGDKAVLQIEKLEKT